MKKEELTSRQLDLLRGLLLARGSLSLDQDVGEYFFDVRAPARRILYFSYISQVFEEWIDSEPSQGRGGELRFKTRASSAFREEENRFYFFNEKTSRRQRKLPEDLSEILTDRVLLCWYMESWSSPVHPGLKESLSDQFALRTATVKVIEKKRLQEYFQKSRGWSPDISYLGSNRKREPFLIFSKKDSEEVRERVFNVLSSDKVFRRK